MRTRIKICGITNVTDALAVVESGADAIGLVFYAPSPRNVSIEQAVEICRHIPSFVTRVALFVDESYENVNTVLTHVPIDSLQFHGSESNDYCKQFKKPFIKALHAKSKTFLDDQVASFPDASSLILDTFIDGVAGGTGKTFDWSLFNHAKTTSNKLILAGGLTPVNVKDAIIKTRPYAVDVSGGVEASKGKKDHLLIKQFIAQVALADKQFEASGS